MRGGRVREVRGGWDEMVGMVGHEGGMRRCERVGKGERERVGG